MYALYCTCSFCTSHIQCSIQCVPFLDQPIKFDSDDVATSDFLSLEEDNSEVVKKKNPSTRVQQPRPQPRLQKQKPKKVARKKSTKPRHRMLSQLHACCNYHEQMNKIRSQSCTLVTNWDMGYDGDRDSEESVDEFLIPDAVPNIPVRQSCQRLKWRLAHTQFWLQYTTTTFLIRTFVVAIFHVSCVYIHVYIMFFPFCDVRVSARPHPVPQRYSAVFSAKIKSKKPTSRSCFSRWPRARELCF